MSLLLHRFRHFFEHQIKHLSVLISMLFPMSLAFLIIIEHLFFQNIESSLFKATIDLRSSDILSVIIGTMTTVVITIFSITMVAIQLTSQQFSPRILRLFLLNDNKIQTFLGIFIGTISYCFLLKTIPFFLPNTPLSIATLFIILVALYAIIWFLPRLIMHIADNVNVASITQRIKNNTVQEIDAMYQDIWKIGDILTYKRQQTDKTKDRIIIRSQVESGYLDDIDYAELSDKCHKIIVTQKDLPDFRILQKPLVGEFIMHDTTDLLEIEMSHISDNQRIILTKAFSDIAESVFKIRKYRSYTNDIPFGIRQLVDIAIKAISPAVNDPTTCLNCLDYMGDIIRQLAVRRFPSSETDVLKSNHIFINEVTFEEATDLAFDQIFHWGKSDPVVVKRLIQTIRAILPMVENPYHVAILIRQVEDMNIRNLMENHYPCSNESKNSVLLELSKFEKNAQNHIQALDQKGILVHYKIHETEQVSEIRELEGKTIDFLKTYLQK
jgi:uncharacterized membrane protein